jgi:hypothetical protein
MGSAAAPHPKRNARSGSIIEPAGRNRIAKKAAATEPAEENVR